METIKPDTNHQSSDPIDLSKLRYSQDFGSVIGVKKAITTILVRGPVSQMFVRAHTDPSYEFQTFVIEFKEDRETYLVDRSLWEILSTELIPKALFGAITKAGDPFLWPVRLAGPESKLSTWSQSALAAVQLARQSWIRVAANMKLGAYDVFQATANLPDPEWPDITMNQMIQIAFKDKFITTLDHPVIKKLKGAQ